MKDMKDSKPTEKVCKTDSKTALEAIEEVLASKGISSTKEVKEMDMKKAMGIVSECFEEALKKKAAEEKAEETEERKEWNIFERYTRAVKNLDIVHRGSNKAAIFVGNYMYTEGQEYTESEIVSYINKELLPWAFLNGIEINDCVKWKPTKTVDYNRVTAEYLYTINNPIVNYAMACMAAAKEHCRLGKKKITAIFYSNIAGKTTIVEYRDTDHFANDIKEELSYMELSYLEATDRDE